MEIKDVRASVKTCFGDWVSKFGELWKSQEATLRERFGAAIVETRVPPQAATDVPIIYVEKQSIVEVLRFLKSQSGFEYDFLADLTATDEHPAEPRFEIVYNLFSTTKHNRIRIKTRVREGETVPTAIGVWLGADWAEREVWDMFGVRFEGHPNLRRILMDHRWEGHPLRKDYPIRKYQLFPTSAEIDLNQLK